MAERVLRQRTNGTQALTGPPKFRADPMRIIEVLYSDAKRPERRLV
jgi:hypothetical protein